MEAKITLLPGDGIGPEVVAEAVKVLTAIATQHNHTFTFTEKMAGGIAIDETGNPLPEETLGACLESNAVLLGAVGGPKWSEWVSKLSNLFMQGEIKTFQDDQIEEAWTWVESE